MMNKFTVSLAALVMAVSVCFIPTTFAAENGEQVSSGGAQNTRCVETGACVSNSGTVYEGNDQAVNDEKSEQDENSEQ